jgi:hypothetical protein
MVVPFLQDAVEMPCVQRNHKVQTLASHRPDDALAHRQRVNVLGFTTRNADRQSNQEESHIIASRIALLARLALT